MQQHLMLLLRVMSLCKRWVGQHLGSYRPPSTSRINGAGAWDGVQPAPVRCSRVRPHLDTTIAAGRLLLLLLQLKRASHDWLCLQPTTS
jgi:hypothetical protein